MDLLYVDPYYFVYRFIKYEWRADRSEFAPILFDCNMTFKQLRDRYTNDDIVGNLKQRQFMQEQFGRCEIAVPKKKVFALLIEEALNPFYLFQVFSMALWYWDGYYYYAFCIFAVSTGSIVVSLYDMITNNE